MNAWRIPVRQGVEYVTTLPPGYEQPLMRVCGEFVYIVAPNQPPLVLQRDPPHGLYCPLLFFSPSLP